MSLLVIDAGNTRIKWAQRESAGDNWGAHGFAAARATVDDLAELRAKAGAASRAGLCCVGGQDMRERLAQVLSGANVTEVKAQKEHAGVRSFYEPPESLGADRWCSLLALREKYGHGVCVVAGTAVTIDGLDEDGKYHGGLILPGRAAMVNALGATTALRLPPAAKLDAVGANEADTTRKAVGTGVLAAIAGAVLWYINHRNFGAAPIVLSGGDANWLAAQLPQAQIDHDLVFAGIACAVDAS